MATLEERLAALEALPPIAQLLLHPEAQAAPPVAIGPFSNVPAPGSPIRSDWPQSVSTWLARHGCSLTTAGQSMPTGGSGTDVPWATEVWDSDSYHAASAAAVVIPTGMGGVYAFAASIDAGGTIGGAAWLAIVSGASINRVFYVPTGQRYLAATTVFEAAAGASITARLWHSHSTAITVSGQFVVARVGSNV